MLKGEPVGGDILGGEGPERLLGHAETPTQNILVVLLFQPGVGLWGGGQPLGGGRRHDTGVGNLIQPVLFHQPVIRCVPCRRKAAVTDHNGASGRNQGDA